MISPNRPNSAPAPSDETLVAYADGELGAEESAEIEARLRLDPEVAARLESLTRAGELARRAYEPALTEPVPRHLVDLVRGQGQGQGQGQDTAQGDDTGHTAQIIEYLATRRPIRMPPAWRPMAAAAGVVLCVAATVGLFLQAETDRRMARPGPDIERLLLEHPSYVGVETAEGTAMVLHSFRDADSRFCREFEVIGAETVRHAIACAPEGTLDWTVVADYAGVPDGGGTETYQPASGLTEDPVTAALERLRAGPFLDPEQEQRMLDGLRDQP
jgi:hypothetical protein